MNSLFGRSSPLAALRKLLGTGLLVLLVGTSVSGTAQATVPVDQQPLTIQRPLPPNILLMLDDSGSMAWNFMPDICYLNGVVCNSAKTSISAKPNNNALIDAANNGVYYNPATTYKPPARADGTFYNNSPGLTGAWVDGFNNTATTVDLTGYAPSSSCSSSSPYVCGGAYEAYSSGSGLGTGKSNIAFSTTTAQSSSQSSTVTETGVTSTQCNTDFQSAPPVASNVNWTKSGSKGTCTWTQTTTTNTTYKYFQFSTGAAAGPYSVYYVAPASQGCGAVPSGVTCVVDTDTSGVAAPAGVPAGQNVANWFSFYRTRILMAKSGLMNAFVGLDAKYRVGFGSIDGGNNSNYNSLPASRYSYSDTYNGGSNYIANVTPFGAGTDATSQKSMFWSWVSAVKASGGTPLRQALAAAGNYYTQAQPWQTMSSDPDPTNTTELACRQSYTILTTDGFWNDSYSGLGNVDGTNGAQISGANGQTYTYNAAAPYSDTVSDSLADVAMKYWSTDLRSATVNEVPPSTDDPAFWQHMTTFTMGLGFTPTGITPAGTTVGQIFNWANGGSAIANFGWPTPASDSINNIADLAHAAVDGHGGFYSATSPDSFVSGLSDALKRASERVGTGASLAANSTSLDTGTYAYQANYYTAKWKGDLKAFTVDSSTGSISTAPFWSAVNALPQVTARKIYTFVPSTGNGSMVEFKNVSGTSGSTPPALSTSELAALGGSDAERMNIVNYLRGDATLEQKNGGSYRNRDTPLGDIVDSQPVYVGIPDANQFVGQTFTGSSTFTTFVSNETSRARQIYIAANDGMLHAFDASTGAETFAYIPGAVITAGAGTAAAYKSLASPDYGNVTTPHQYYNDGELTVADVYQNSGAGSWHTVLVGTTGRGPAKAIYALDVTDPTNVSFLWERSASDSDYIGQMIGKPVIAQTSDGSWSVLIGNGYNSKQNVAALLVFDLFSGALTTYPTDSTTDNGLAAPAVWMTDPGTGVGTIAYAGDLNGRVWSFDITKSNGKATKLFTATDSGGTAQPITAGMLAGKDPANGNVWLFFGTGKYLSSGDLTVNSSTQTQTWYGLIVQSSNTSLKTLSGRGSLVSRSIVAETAGSTTPTLTLPARLVTSAADATAIGNNPGWYIDLLAPTGVNGAGVTQGERMVTPNQFQGNLLLGTTRIPVATDICNPSGRGWIMALDPFTGTNPSSSFFDLNGDGVIDGSDMVTSGGKTYPAAGVGFSSLPNNPIFVGGSMLVSFDNGTTSSLHTSGSTGGLQRVSWRELIGQ